MKSVLDSDEGVCCDDACERWFHRECLKMPKAEYQRISSDNNYKWVCTRTDCKKASTDPINGKLDAILAKLSSLATKVELAEGLKSIKKDLDKVTTKINELEPRLSKVETEVTTLRDKHTADDGRLLEDFVSEYKDRNRRSKNIIIYNMPELDRTSSSTNSKAHDSNLVHDFLVHMKSPIPITEVRHFRLGKNPHENKSRPLVVCMPSDGAAIHIFKNFDKDNVPGNMQGVSLSHDRTPRERKYLEDLRSSLEDRKKSGERDLTIRFVNGTPTIVSKNG